MNISDHPAMKAIMADVAAANLKEEEARTVAQMEAARLRAEQGHYLSGQFNHALGEYERVRALYHDALGAVWRAANDYSRVTGVHPSSFALALFSDAHAPRLSGPAAYGMSPGWTTTRAAIAAWYGDGKTWA